VLNVLTQQINAHNALTYLDKVWINVIVKILTMIMVRMLLVYHVLLLVLIALAILYV